LIEAITKIKEAEEAGDVLVTKANEDAQDIIRAAGVTARDRVKAIRDETRKKRLAILEKAKADAKAACEPLDDAAAKDIERILQPDGAAFNAAVNQLVGKIAS
jgi:vacuolar-type H+-ATPase subunit H